MAHLMEYLGGAAGTAYGNKRIALGHPAAWTGIFSKIHIEFGNENWNSIFEGIDWPIPYGERGNDLFAAAKATPTYSANSGKFDFVLGGQSVYLGRNQEIHNASANHDSLAIAPYLMFQVDNFANNEDLFGSLFAEAESHSTSATTHDGSATALGNYISLQSSTHHVPLSVYEVNLHTTNGSINQATLDSFTPSLGAGLGVSSHMLQMMRGENVLNQMLFSFAQESFTREDGKKVKLWGTIVDHGITNRKRPQFLTAQLANTALQGSMCKTTHEGPNPTWNQSLMNGTQLNNAHYLQSFFLVDGIHRGLIIYNLHRTSSMDVTFSGTHSPQTNVAVNRLTGPAITATNETASNVTITPQSYTNFDPNAPFSLPPYSMTVLKWNIDGTMP
jgi:alpha-L-arabinofuranosidase